MEAIHSNEHQRNILFVESDKGLIHDLKDYIDHHEIRAQHNLEFVFVNDCKEAMKKLAEQKIDLIVLEVVLPVVNGYYLLNYLKKNQNIPVIVYTRLKGPQDLAKLASYEVDNIFLKQLMKMEDLLQIIISYGGEKVDLDQTLLELQSQVKSLSEGEAQAALKITQCPKCHMILAPDSHFCNNCGQKIFRKQKALKPKPVKK